MGKEEGEFNIGKQKAERDIYMAKKITVYQPAEKEKLNFPFEPSLHNQTPPEENFVGREKYLKTITDWYKSSKVRIGALIGWGGVGKSALVRKWYDSLEANNIKPDGVFWWGFYRNANLELFLNALLRYVSGGQIEPEEIKGTWEKVERIKENTGKGAYLIILDGLEEMQKGQTSGEEFGCMEHKECAEMLKFLADNKGAGLCLITTRYPLTDIENYEGTTYQKAEVERLSKEDGRRLFEKIGVKRSQKEIDSVIDDYKGHALSLTLLAGYLVEDFGGDITKAKDIPPFHSDKEAGGKAHRMLCWYEAQLKEEQRTFMKIFSLFRINVTENDFEGIFRKPIKRFIKVINRSLAGIQPFHFKVMVKNLCDRRLISRNTEGSYTTHPLIKNYFESIFEQKDKKLCHKRIYKYFGEHAPQRPETLEEMQPLFEQVYHGCAAGLYDEVYWDVYWEKIHKREEHFIIHKLGAWETDIALAEAFFPEGDLLQIPLVSDKSGQSWLFGVAGLALLSTGRPKEAEGPFLTGVEMDIETKDWENASVGYQNLAELRFRTADLVSALDSSKKALGLAERARSDRDIRDSKAFLGWILYLLGKTEKAEKEFSQADEIEKKISGYRLYGIGGVSNADFLISMGKINEAFELTRQNLEICKSNSWPDDISRCYRCLGAIERIKGNYKEAEGHLEEALEIARKVGMPFLEIEALFERSRLRLDMGKYEDAIGDAEQVLKICGRTGFRFYEPRAEIVLGKAYLALRLRSGRASNGSTSSPQASLGQAETNARTAYEKAAGMKYRWAEGDAGHLLGEIYSAMGQKRQAAEWIKKAVKCRKEILDPKAKESEAILEKLG